MRGAGIMRESIKLPIGIDDFEKIRKNSFYYVDKTKLIEQGSTGGVLDQYQWKRFCETICG